MDSTFCVLCFNKYEQERDEYIDRTLGRTKMEIGLGLGSHYNNAFLSIQCV